MTEFLGLSASCAGDSISFAKLENKLTVVVSVPESRMMSPQHVNSLKELGLLHERYHASGLEILAFPCDVCGGQSGGARDSRAMRLWLEKIGLNFHVMDKVEVNGENAHPVYKFLKQNGPDVAGHFQSSFLVVCKRAHCKVYRFERLPPRALWSRVEELLCELEDRGPLDDVMLEAA
eukprot:TRINITY_DN39809_c0_g1_i1.p1 TRINITY_DN39809_c0_g1~~TRINITY_DN39809_c0_g1_i1.p1  ORF type:complete len:177 (+),score=33.04 TRINITY_DN39809_c0_g1_i1:250-780(+)